MLIEESSENWYWPQIPWELLGAFRESHVLYPDEYEALWNGFEEMIQDGDNVDRDSINANIDALESGVFIPEGYLRSDDDTLGPDMYELVEGAVVARGDVEPTGWRQVYCQLFGYMVWQRYRLALALQASKLTEFGRRGRRGI